MPANEVQYRERFIFLCVGCRHYYTVVATFTLGVGVDLNDMISRQAVHMQKQRARCSKCRAAPPTWHFEHLAADAKVEPSGSEELDCLRMGKPLPAGLQVIEGGKK